MTSQEAGAIMSFAYELGECETLQYVWSDRGVLIRDANHTSFTTIDEYLGRICSADNKPYYTMSQNQRELFAFALGSIVPAEQKYLMVRAERTDG